MWLPIIFCSTFASDDRFLQLAHIQKSIYFFQKFDFSSCAISYPEISVYIRTDIDILAKNPA